MALGRVLGIAVIVTRMITSISTRHATKSIKCQSRMFYGCYVQNVRYIRSQVYNCIDVCREKKRS